MNLAPPIPRLGIREGGEVTADARVAMVNRTPVKSRAGAVRRSEYERASLDTALLSDALARTGSIAERARYASAPANALLEERASDNTATESERAVLSAVEQLLDSRRRATRLPVATVADSASAAHASTKVADALDWDNASWFASAVRYANDGRGAQQWYDRSLAT